MPDVPSSLPAEAPKRIQRKRTKGFRLPEGAAVIDRTTRFGNPWTVKQGYSREECVARFETYLIVRRNPPPGWVDVVGYPSDAEIRETLGGRDLACWCSTPEDGQPDICHGSPLLLTANEVPATGEAIEEGFLRVPLADGGEWVSLSRLTDGRVACCVCFKFCHRHELEPVAGEPGKVWDVCRECAQSEGVAGV